MAPNHQNIVITHAFRTAIGSFSGGLKSVSASQLGAVVLKKLLEESTVAPEKVSEVILGQVLTANAGQNPARQTTLASGLPHETSAITINQVCGSGLRAIALAYQSILAGDGSIIIAGGQENMSQAPHAIHLRDGIKMGDGSAKDTMIQDGLWDAMNNYHMGTTAENLATKYAISRQEQDEFAANSQNKAELAQKNNRFDNEIVPVTIKHRKGDIVVDTDEFPRHGTTAESLAKLRPAFSKEGTVTAGNASGINDGAAAVLVMTEEEANKHGLKPLARIVSVAQAGVDPSIMGIGPVYAARKALEKANWSIDDLDLVESNEAFAAQAISVNKELGWDTSKINVNGGAIALGHPIGASGARIMVSLLHEMQKQDNVQKGLATLCVGGGMGVAVCVEKV